MARWLFLTTSDLDGSQGDSTHSASLIAALRERGQKVFVFARASHRMQQAALVTEAIDQRFLLVSFVVFHLKMLFFVITRGRSADVIYARDPSSALIGKIGSLFSQARLVYEVNSLSYLERLLRTDSRIRRSIAAGARYVLQVLAIHSAALNIAVTPTLGATLLGEFRIPQSRTRVIDNGVDPTLFHPSDKLACRAATGISPDSRVILFVGNLAPWQGLEILVSATRMLVETDPRIVTIVVGEGVLRRKLEKSLESLGLGEAFLLIGSVPHAKVPLYINAADACVIPYAAPMLFQKVGRSPLKLWEYLACGRPVVLGGLRDFEYIVREARVSVSVGPDDFRQLAAALRRVLDSPDISMRAVEFSNVVRATRSWSAVGQRIVAAVLGIPPRGPLVNE